jgi:lysozyme family protein
MTPRFLAYFNWLIPQECAYKRGHYGDLNYVTWENVKGDRGGVTKYGIDSRSHPTTDIKNLTLEQAREIYWLEYWLPSLAEHMPDGYGEVLADIRVNGGDGPRMLQRALNTLGCSLTVDGRLGPKSMEAMRLFLRARQARYDRLAKKPDLSGFHLGWTHRNNSLAKFVGVA